MAECRSRAAVVLAALLTPNLKTCARNLRKLKSVLPMRSVPSSPQKIVCVMLSVSATKRRIALAMSRAILRLLRLKAPMFLPMIAVVLKRPRKRSSVCARSLPSRQPRSRRRSVRLQAKKWGTMIRLVPLPTKMQRFHHAMRSLPIATDRLLTFAVN